MNKEKLIPELRFPSFKKNDDWKDVKLIDVTNKGKKWSFTGGPFGSDLKSSDYVEESEGIRIIQLQNIGDGEFKNNNKIYTSKEKADELLSCNIYPGDIIMSKMGDPVGRACLIPDYHNRYVMSSDGIRIAVDEDKYDKYFIYLVINSKVFRSKVENSSTGSTRKRIGLIDLKKLTLTVPKTKEEQKKIANCLSSLDTLITVEIEKIEHLKDHKKGLLQQLFPVNGETKPQFRFPEFKNDGDWEETTLEKCLDYLQPTPYLVSSTAYKDKYETPVLTAGKTFILGYTDEEEGIFNKNLPVIIFDDFTTATKFVDFHFKAKSSAMKILLPKGNNNIQFLFETIQNLQFEVSTHKRHWISVFSKLNILIPKDPKEQEKIADCFSSVDDLITTQTEKITALKDHKKGLMQQLFPNIK